MCSSDDEARSPGLGASSSKHAVPPLDSDDAYDEDALPQNIQGMAYKSDNWRTVLRFSKGEDAIMGEDEMQLRIYAACNQLMDDARMVRLAGHVPAPSDVGLWKLKTEFTIDSGRTRVRWMECPMLCRCGCKCQIKIFDGPEYCLLEVRGNHDADSHVPLKQADRHAPRKDEYENHGSCHADLVRKYGHSYERCFKSHERLQPSQSELDAVMAEINAATSEEDEEFDNEMNAVQKAARDGHMRPMNDYLRRHEQAGKEARMKRSLEDSPPATLSGTTTGAPAKRKCRSTIPRIEVSHGTSSSECSNDYESEDCFWDPLIAAIPELRHARDALCLSPKTRRIMAEVVKNLIYSPPLIHGRVTLLVAGGQRTGRRAITAVYALPRRSWGR